MSDLNSTNAALLPMPRLLIDGKWIDAADGATFETIDPASETVICAVARGRAEDVDRACRAAHRALSGPWRRLTPFERGRMLMRLADLVDRDIDLLAGLERRDVGKPAGEAEGDIRGVANCLRYNAGAADKMEGATIPLGPDYVDFTELEPVGVTAHIVPWNYPLGMAARSVAPALAAGCTVVLKPAEQSPLTALAFGRLCQEAGLPEGVVNIVTGYGLEAGDPLVRHPLVRSITFTGSIATGRNIYAAAAPGLTPVVLELGGKNPMIVCADADIDRATTDALDASFGNSGQVCSSASRYILHRSIRDAFLDALAAKVAQLRVGPPEDNPHLGPLASREQYEKVLGYLRLGEKDGLRLRFGGARPPGLDRGYYLAPTVFEDVDPDHPLATEEIFGPVAVACTFDDDDEAVDLANRLETGLVAGLYTRDISRALALGRRLDFGSVWINGWFIGGLQAPTGGEKSSGIGRERGLPGIRNYLRIKNIGIRI
ncbi:MAG: aldehyde dehydrogenase [Rhodobacteraceae bacterium]|jgi:aldehyde dehydrogenase (NAD+)|nr:aldehyde dehydrogenase [Paracoccaceae bacterium]